MRDLKYGWLLFFGLLTAHAQTKKQITPQDYNKWAELKWEKLSPDAKWVAFTMDYETGNDTLFLQEVKTKKSIAFVNGKEYGFSGDSGWFWYRSGSALHLENLFSGRNYNLANVKSPVFDSKTAVLAILSNQQLELYSAHDNKQLHFEGVTDFAFSGSGKLAFVTTQGIHVLDGLQNAPRNSVKAADGTFSNPVWDGSGTQLAFTVSPGAGESFVALYNSITQKLQYNGSGMFENAGVTLVPDWKMAFTPDNEKVMLYVKATGTANQPDDTLVQVWDASSPLDYKAQREYETYHFLPGVALWNPRDNALTKLVADSLPTIKLLPNRKLMLSFNPYLAQERPLDYPLAAIYKTDIVTGKTELLLKSQSTNTELLRASPDSRFIAYYDARGWNVYDCTTGSVTTVFDSAMVGEGYGEDEKQGNSSPGWTSDGKFLIVCSGLDIWLLSPDGNQKKRLTNGRENGVRFRPVGELHRPSETIKNEYLFSGYFNLSEGLFLEAVYPDKSRGIYRYTDTKGLQLLYRSKGKVTGTALSANKREILLREETIDIPQHIMLVDTNTKTAKVLFQSNPHYVYYATPRAELLSYANTAGKPLQAVLHYPANYHPGTKYPMVTFIYEKLARFRHDYNFPKHRDPIGFETANYTNEGYFVLYPDISYTIGDPGTAMADCVLSAVAKATELEDIDQKRLGLLGHSYGGHEVSLLITKTNIFAAAVAGAAVTDMSSDYLRPLASGGRSKFWFYEVHQYRMGKSIWENRDGYAKNTPVLHADKITTPLLSWAGQDDESINWQQGAELHNALKRLKKKNTFLLYPGEGHILRNPAAQLDLTQRIKKWFDHYLK